VRSGETLRFRPRRCLPRSHACDSLSGLASKSAHVAVRKRLLPAKAGASSASARATACRPEQASRRRRRRRPHPGESGSARSAPSRRSVANRPAARPIGCSRTGAAIRLVGPVQRWWPPRLEEESGKGLRRVKPSLRWVPPNRGLACPPRERSREWSSTAPDAGSASLPSAQVC
jgi:hypothetical protein